MRKRTRPRDPEPGLSPAAAAAASPARRASTSAAGAAPGAGTPRTGTLRALSVAAGNRIAGRVLDDAVARTTLVPREAAARHPGSADRGDTIRRDVGYDQLDGSTIEATVNDGANPITMTGSYRIDPQHVGDINATLAYHVVTVPKAAVSNSFFNFGTVRALEISTVDAAPRGRRIGQILAWHLAGVAEAAGIGYVTAGNVSDARAPFYTPLGFIDFRNAPTWASLVARKAELEAQMTGPGVPDPEVVTEYQGVLEAMEANHIFIPTATLKANAYASWSQRWAPA